MTMKILMSVLFFVPMAWACPVGKTGLSKKERQQQLKSLKKIKPPVRDVAATGWGLPTALSLQPWGGRDPLRWAPEAVLANAVSAALNEGWQRPGAVDVLVSVPVKMIFTNQRVYGDGQTNAAVEFGPGWVARQPQMVATLVRFRTGQRLLNLRFATATQLKVSKAEIIGFVPQGAGFNRKQLTVTLSAQPDGWTGSVDLPPDWIFGDLERNLVAWVRPNGWDSSFPLDFRFPMVPAAALIAAAGNARTAGRKPFDPMEVSARSAQDRQIAQLVLLNTKFGPEWVKNDRGGNELRNESIHGEIGTAQGVRKTAVGGGLTWLVERGTHSRFKNLYTCFDARDFAKETASGVPSGGGWHEIGDAAETIINNLERVPVPVGHAVGMPAPVPPDGLKFPWGLTDVATIRLLFPGESLMTPAGDRTWAEDEPWRSKGDGGQRARDLTAAAGRNYHWFFFPSTAPVCTQEWVHHCRPTAQNQFGLACP